jgi:hypothetical protein
LQKEERAKSENFMRGPLFVDKLLDIGQETDLLAETKDIRDELNMIRKVLDDQLQVLPDLGAAVCEIYYNEHRSQYDVKKKFKEQIKAVELHIKDIERMEAQAERIYSSITDMLDLKQKHANAFEARFARDQAAGTARQSQTIMVFTIVSYGNARYFFLISREGISLFPPQICSYRLSKSKLRHINCSTQLKD